MKKYNIICFLFALSQMAYCQEQYTSGLEKVAKSGVYRIVLPTQFVSTSTSDKPNFRIFDSQNKEVPFAYLDNFSNPLLSFNEFKVISRKTEPNKKSALVFENSNPQLDYITLIIANYTGEKTFIVSGSNDLNLWFGILQPTILNDLTEDTFAVQKNLSLPKTNYKFLKIETIDKNSLPINILKVGQRITSNKTNEFNEIAAKSLKFNYIRSSKNTIITAEFENYQKIEKLQFDIIEPQNYLRNIRLYTIENQKIRRKNQLIEVDFANFELSPTTNKNLEISAKKAKRIFIEIENQDSPPLAISSIKFFQKPIIIQAALKANENYVLKSQASNSVYPNYDLSQYNNIEVENLPILKIINVQKTVPKTKVNPTKTFWNSPVFLWLCIGLAAVALMLFVRSFIKDIKKQNI